MGVGLSLFKNRTESGLSPGFSLRCCRGKNSLILSVGVVCEFFGCK